MSRSRVRRRRDAHRAQPAAAKLSRLSKSHTDQPAASAHVKNADVRKDRVVRDVVVPIPSESTPDLSI